MTTIWRLEGYDVATAADGREAVAKFRSAAFDLVITDLIMPEKEGLETIAEMKTLRSNVPVIAMSGGGRIGPTDYLETARYIGGGRDARQTVRAQRTDLARQQPAVRGGVLTATEPTLLERYLADTDRDELAAALLVARTLEPAVDEGEVRTALAELGDRSSRRVCARSSRRNRSPTFLRDEGFKATDNLQSLDASRIDKVLSSHRGIPITLSIPYLMVGRALGMTTQGINFPGHFLLSANGVLIDPLTADLLSSADVERWLTDANLTHLGPNALAPASPDEMAVRMFNNVKAIYAARGDFVEALALIDCQMPLVGDTGPLHLERAEFWFRLGDAAAAASVLRGSARASSPERAGKPRSTSGLKRLGRPAAARRSTRRSSAAFPDTDRRRRVRSGGHIRARGSACR